MTTMQGRCSPGCSVPCSVLVWAVAVLLAGAVVQAVDHKVGGATSSGWNKPNGNTLPDTYLQQWAAGESFTQGDRLMFDYSPVAHNVLVVSLADYVRCNTLSPLATYATGKDAVAIPAGPSYYICGIPTHCESGQKFNITAAASSTARNSAITATNAVPVAATIAVVVVATIALL